MTWRSPKLPTIPPRLRGAFPRYWEPSYVNTPADRHDVHWIVTPYDKTWRDMLTGVVHKLELHKRGEDEFVTIVCNGYRPHVGRQMGRRKRRNVLQRAKWQPATCLECVGKS